MNRINGRREGFVRKQKVYTGERKNESGRLTKKSPVFRDILKGIPSHPPPLSRLAVRLVVQLNSGGVRGRSAIVIVVRNVQR